MGSKTSRISDSTTSESKETSHNKTGDNENEQNINKSKPPMSRKKSSIVFDEQGRRTSLIAGKTQTKKRRRTLDPMNYEDEELRRFRQKQELIEKEKKKKKKGKIENKNGVDDDDDNDNEKYDARHIQPRHDDDDDDTINLIQYENFEYPFENIVFEGGGNKGLAYAGAVREFERIGLWNNIRRFGGASAGAMWATLLAIGYNSYEVEYFLSMNLKEYFLDATCGTCSLFPNLRRHFGWHPARRLFEWFGDRLEEKTGDADITFKQLYTFTGKELCIVVTNLSQMSAEYCHVKTTPNLPIRMAVRMSIAIPGLFGAVKSKKRKNYDIFVDGGVLCNYPIHCYDGWWLSMEPTDSMLRRMQPLEDIGKLWDKKERFGTINPLTLGMLLYSSDEQDMMVDKLSRREAKIPPQELPNTKLSRQRNKIKQKREEETRNHALITAAMSGFLKLLSESDINENSIITRDELENAFSKNPSYFTHTHRKDLFGEEMTVDEIFDKMDHNADNEITFDELQSFAEERGVEIQANFQGYSRKNIKGFADFLGTLQETLLVNVKRVFVTEDDVDRTLGIDTVYVDTTDFVLDVKDREFLVQQGVRGVQAFLRHYVRKNDPPLKAILRGVNDTQSTVLFDDLHR